MLEQKCDIAAAVDWISNLHDEIVQGFLSSLKEVPSFGDPVIDSQVSTYIDGLGNWIRANVCWSFEVSSFR